MSQSQYSKESSTSVNEEVDVESVYDEEEDEDDGIYDDQNDEEKDDAIQNSQEVENDGICDEQGDEDEDEDYVETNEPVEDAPVIKQSSEVLMKYGCLVCKNSTVFTYNAPSQHNAATGVYVCRWCSEELKNKKLGRLEEEKRKAAGEVGERVYYTRDEAGKGKRKVAEEKGLWNLLLSSDVSSWPLASTGVEGYALYRLQTIKDNPIKPEPEVEPNHCTYRCSCPHKRKKEKSALLAGRCPWDRDEDDYSKYPACDVCRSEIYTVSTYNRHDDSEPNCGHLYCVNCSTYICKDHIDDHRHSRTWIITYEESFEYMYGRVPDYNVCLNHRTTSYNHIDMSMLRSVCEDCCDEFPNNDYTYFRKAGSIIRDRLATAIATVVRRKGRGLGVINDARGVIIASAPFLSASSNKSERSGPAHGSTIEQPSLSIPALINLFKQVEIPFFDLLKVLIEIDDTIRGMLPVDKTEKEESVESKTLGKRITVRTWQYKTPLDEHVDTCRRLWGEVSNDLINRVEVYAKSRYGMARSIEHCLNALKVSSLLMPSDSTERNQEEKGGSEKTCQQGEMRSEVTGKDSSQVPERASAVAKCVTKDDILSTLNQVPITRESVSEEVTYLRTLECLRETIEYGDSLFLTLTKEKVETISSSLMPSLVKIKESALALKESQSKEIETSFVDQVKALINSHAELLKTAGKVEYWMTN